MNRRFVLSMLTLLATACLVLSTAAMLLAFFLAI